MFRRCFCFHCCFSNLLFFLGVVGRGCVRVPGLHGIFHFRFSFWVFISTYVFTLGVCIVSAQLGNGLSLTVCVRHLHPCLSCACVHKQNRCAWYVIFTFSQSFEWVRILLLYKFLPLFSGLFSLLVLFCASGLVWFLHFLSAFTFLWMLIKREHPSCMELLYQPFPPFY